MPKIFIVAPADAVTGGPELLHQLGDALNRDGQRAWMLYSPFRRSHITPQPYARYNVDTARIEDVEPGSIVIMNEYGTTLIKQFPAARVYLWWLSVDNFFEHARFTYRGRLLGEKRVANARIRRFRPLVERHLYQSEYAREFLASASLAPATRLSDYLADEYLQEPQTPRATRRENVVVYNPKKGKKRTREILRALREIDGPMPQLVALEDMTRSEICEVLARAKLYIDFGPHPGKDRIPREAAALGTCILVNRRGSAANPVDINIPDEFKIDDTMDGYAKLAAQRIQMIMQDFERLAPRFEDYRRKITAEPAEFIADVRAAFPRDR